MDINDRIARRYRPDDGPGLIRDHEAISPAAHRREPIGRGPTLERLLDRLDPAFDGTTPPNTYVHGPKGAGKSALVAALFGELDRLTRRSRSSIHTTTRVDDTPVATFAYVDARTARTEFALRHAVLDAVVETSVPKQGVDTAHLRSVLADHAARSVGPTVVALDHADESTDSLAVVEEFLADAGSVAWVGVGRAPPDELGIGPVEAVTIERYQPYLLVDVLSGRVSAGLARGALDHDHLREIAEWADGDAHDALAAVFGAAVTATDAGDDHVDAAAVEAGMAAVPRRCVPIGRVLALPANRQCVLRALLDGDRHESVGAAASAIAATEWVDLSTTTVERILYELAADGVVRRVSERRSGGLGRPPSRIEPCFATRVFERLFDLASE